MADLITNGARLEAMDMAVAKEFGETLNTAYPGWLWAIEMPQHNVVVRLINAPVQGMGFFIPRTKLGTPDTNRKLALWAGGEWLERLGLPRARMPDSDLGALRMEGTKLRQYIDSASRAKAAAHGDS